MPGSNLMCIWHAAYVKDGGIQSDVLKPSVLKDVTRHVFAQCGATFSAEEFDSVIQPDIVPEFDLYCTYLRDQLMIEMTGAKYNEIMKIVEESCWKMCTNAYQSTTIDLEQDILRLWQIFNRLTEEGSYPPIAYEAESTWLANRIAVAYGSPSKGINQFPDSGMTFQALLDYLVSVHFVDVAAKSLIHETISDAYNYVVLQVLTSGWLHKRTCKQSNWTNWQRRWFVCKPGKLTYYESEDRLEKKGEVMIDANARVECITKHFRSFMKSLSGRFKVSISEKFDIEMATGNDNERELWMNAIEEIILAAREGSTPLQLKLRDQRYKLKLTKIRLNDPPSGRNTPTLPQSNYSNTPSPVNTPTQQRKEYNSNIPIKKKQAGAFTLVTPKTDTHSHEGEGSENDDDFEKRKIQAIFLRIDTDGNGRIDANEFKEFIAKGLNLAMSDAEVNLTFNVLDKKKIGCIGFEEFYNYFINVILDENLTGVESQMRAAFLQADRNGTGTIDFREFSDFVWTRRQTITAKKLAEIFDEMDEGKTGEVAYDNFRSFVSRQGSLKSLALKPASSTGAKPEQQLTTSVNQLETQFKNIYRESDANEIAAFLRNRWNKFASFKRVGGAGDLVMTGGSGMVADVLPGEYSLLDLACFNDLPPIVPRHVEVKGVHWNTSTVPGVSGKVLFPEDFDGYLPIEIATNEHLAYYDCSLAESSQLKVALLYRHGIQDFTYQNNYLDEYIKDERKVGGGGLEHHDFAHLDCPLDDDSGYFVIGKLVNKTELHLTGFKVPTRHTLYLPGGVIHCNDYLKGTWRTMLSDEADIDHAHIVRSSRKGNMTTMEHFVFAFHS